jgi:hypothetical protein
LVRAGVNAAIAEDAAIPIDEDVQLTLEAALRFLKANGLGVTDFDFERSVE